MLELGKRIAFHRKRLDMTQTELGEKLNVTAQAVSKWENGLSDPDLGTLHRLSKIFGVSTDELIAEDGTEDEALPADAEMATAETPTETESSVAPADPPAPVPVPTPEPVQQKVIIGYCRDCKKPLEEKDHYTLQHGGRGQADYLLCDKCEKERRLRQKNSEIYDEKKAFRRSMIWGPIAGGVTALIFLIAAICTGNYTLLAGFLVAVGAFALVSQLFWGDWLFDFLEIFVHAFHLPGLIFTLDLDGIVWFITVKLTLSILAGLLSAMIFLFGLALAMLVGIFTYPFALVAKLHKIRRLEAEYDNMK